MLWRTSGGIPLSEDAFNSAADALSIEAAKLWAVMDVEAKRCGFLPDRRPIVLFERHKFHKYTAGRYTDMYPDISSPSAGGYGAGGTHQYARLERAADLDLVAAISSTSWGLGQVMGSNAAIAGFNSPEAMVKDMSHSEDSQLMGDGTFHS
jgi:hypothetical protein